MKFSINLLISRATHTYLLALLLMFFSFRSFGQSCDCPTVDTCGDCTEGLSSLTLRYDAPLLGPAVVTVSDKGGVIFNQMVNDGEEFTVTSSVPNESFIGDTVTITAEIISTDAISVVEIYASCDSPINIGDEYGKFTVTGGESKSGSPICCAASDMDNTPPEITGCPADITTTLSDSECSTAVSWSPPSASDDCELSSFTSTYNPGDVFSVGTTEVVYTATDIYGNTSTCSFNIIVKDETSPVISGCPTDIVITTDGSCESSASWTEPTATDNCNGLTITSTHSPGDIFSIGTTTVTYTATDAAGNSTTCSFNVEVREEIYPVIEGCPGNINLNTSPETSCEAQAIWDEPIASDNCSVTLTSTHKSGDIFPRGKTTVTYTATDASGNVTTCSFDVIANDATKPVISGCPTSDIIASADNSCEASVTWDQITATDNCGSVILESSHNPGDVFPVGKTKVTYTATDDTGNSSKCFFNVVVTEDIPPVISGCPSNIVAATSDSTCTAIVDWSKPTATDNCQKLNFKNTHNPGDAFPVGTTTVIYTATDFSGNTDTCSFDVIVNDETDPVITGCPSDILATADGSCQAIVNWDAPAATDNCQNVTLSSTHNSGDTFSVGTTQVTFTATDEAGNSATCSFNVKVNDETDPVISECPADIVATADDSCQASVSWTAPTATDNCSVTITSTHNSGDSFSIGTTQVTYTATDEAGNTATCSFNVTVNDETDPVISECPADIVATADASCQASISWTAPTATDNCSVTITSTHNSGDSFPIGTTQVTYTATDEAGNAATCSFSVTVNDESDPVISDCPSDIVAAADNSCEAVVNWPEITATDNCNNITLTSTHNSGDNFPIGTTQVSYTATDEAENTATCSFKVIVKDETAPVISGCPNSDITAAGDESCGAAVNWAEPTASDNCSVTFTSSHNPGDYFPVGATEVTYTATDDQGNISECRFKVVVENINPPVISGCPEDINAHVDESGQMRVDWIPPTAEVACGETSLEGSHEPGDSFSLGTTVVEYIATDNAGSSTFCKFRIILTYEDIKFNIPKVITPDGDGINDEWALTNIEKFKQNKVIIVDRWGSIIYSASGYNNENVVWKGENRNGALVPSGTYFYTISVKFASQVVEKKGFIELIQ